MSETPTIPPRKVSSKSGRPKTTFRNLDDMNHFVTNVMSFRKEMARQLSDPRTDVYEECGFPEEGAPIPAEEFYRFYLRDAIANRAMSVMAKCCWQVQPELIESEDGQEQRLFEQDWKDLGASLRAGGEESYYDTDEDQGHPMWEYCQRAQILCGVGTYGIMLLGFNDNKELDLPVEPAEGMKILYVRVFPENFAPILAVENSPKSPRFGQPEFYNLTFNDPLAGTSSPGLNVATRKVHWTRVIHYPGENKTSSETHAVPRLNPLANNLLGLQKVYGGSPVMYWRAASPGISIESHPQLGGDVAVDVEGLKDMMEDYEASLSKWIHLVGLTAKSLAPQVSDPTSQINVQIEAVCICLGIPIRIFKGSERGELASTQDDEAWNDEVRALQTSWVTPWIIVPLVLRLIRMKVLRPPTRFKVKWPSISSQTDAEIATVATAQTNAMTQYVGGGVEALITPFDWFTQILKLDDDTAAMICENAAMANAGLAEPVEDEPQPADESIQPSKEIDGEEVEELEPEVLSLDLDDEEDDVYARVYPN